MPEPTIDLLDLAPNRHLPEIRRGDMQSLIDAFPCLKRKEVRWQTGERRNGNVDFIAQIPGMSDGERHAACFILSVWNLYDEQPKRLRFHAVRAISCWGDGERAAFLAWSMDPWTA
jgi:hypothetical protein